MYKSTLSIILICGWYLYEPVAAKKVSEPGVVN